MIMRLRIIALAALAALALSSCQGNGKREAPVSGELTLHGLEDGKWTYFSVETGESVGSSTFLSEEEDAAWAQREDWDFAICGDYLKTNGGTSGKGRRHNEGERAQLPDPHRSPDTRLPDR